MSKPTIICENYKTEIKLTESLAAPLIESTRRQYEQQIPHKRANIRKRTSADQNQHRRFVLVPGFIDDQ